MKWYDFNAYFSIPQAYDFDGNIYGVYCDERKVYVVLKL